VDKVITEDLVKDHSSYGSWAELPAINPSKRHVKNRFLFANTIRRPAGVNNRVRIRCSNFLFLLLNHAVQHFPIATPCAQVTKFDLDEKILEAHWSPGEGGGLLCEPQMVPRPGATDEDDGVVIAPSFLGDGRTLVAVLDARTLEELARAYTPVTVPMGFHSAFMPLEGKA
jgi:carotenoid cleavage dioxygenase-like enzyme